MSRRRPVPVAGALVVAVLTIVALAVGGCTPRGEGDSAQTGHPSGSAGAGRSGASGSPTPSSKAASNDQDPARYARQVRTHAGAAAIGAQLLMAILYNESYKPHDPAAERAWQRLKPDSAFGIANMHQAAFNDVKQGRGFAGRDWSELPDDPDLAIEAAAWYLHDLAAQLPGSWSGPYSRDELLALGYNAGAGSMQEFAAGARPGQVAQSYLDKLRANWAKAGNAVR